jgi:hypothetical protein
VGALSYRVRLQTWPSRFRNFDIVTGQVISNSFIIS